MRHLLPLIAALTVAAANNNDLYTQTLAQACGNDIMHFCSSSIGSTDQMKACITTHKKEMSPDCQKVLKK